MYGPPRDCKRKFGRGDKSAAMYFSLIRTTTFLGRRQFVPPFRAPSTPKGSSADGLTKLLLEKNNRTRNNTPGYVVESFLRRTGPSSSACRQYAGGAKNGILFESEILAEFARAIYSDFSSPPMSNQEMVARTDELTDTVQVVTESFPNLRGRPSAERRRLVSLADL
jgi:hypothetical protein